MPQTIKRKTVLTTKSNAINFIIIIITFADSFTPAPCVDGDTHFRYCYLYNLYIKRIYLMYNLYMICHTFRRTLFWAKFIPQINNVQKTNSLRV